MKLEALFVPELLFLFSASNVRLVIAPELQCGSRGAVFDDEPEKYPHEALQIDVVYMAETRQALQGVGAHEFDCPGALREGAVAADKIGADGVVEVNQEAVVTVGARTLRGHRDLNVVDADIAVEDMAVDQQRPVAADSDALFFFFGYSLLACDLWR